MGMHRNFGLAAIVLASLVGCHTSDEIRTEPVNLLQSYSASTTTSDRTKVAEVVAPGGSKLVVDAQGVASLLDMFNSTGVKIDLSCNELSKLPSGTQETLGRLESNQFLLGYFMIEATPVNVPPAPEAPPVATPEAHPSATEAQATYPVPIRFYYMPPTPAQAIPAGSVDVFISSGGGFTKVGTLSITADLPQLISGTLSIPATTGRLTLIFVAKGRTPTGAGGGS